MAKYSIDDKNITMIGRTHKIENVLWCGFSGTGIIFDTKAKEVKVSFVGDSSTRGQVTEGLARMSIEVDGNRVEDFMMNEPDIVKTVSLDGNKHTVQVIKLSESAMSLAGISMVEADGEIAKTVLPEFKIEFVGDSITCGYGVDMEDPLVPFKTENEDCTKAYAYRTAKKLNAQYSLVSLSGYGIITGYTDNDEKKEHQLIPSYYEKRGFSYASTAEGVNLQDISWDFSEYQPELVVINLGTNDFSYCKDIEERLEDYIVHYVLFLKTVRKHNPSAKILLTLGLMDALDFKNVEEVCRRYKEETGDTNIYTVPLSLQKPEDGLVSDYHPTVISHEKAAVTVSTKIKELFNM